MVALRTSFVLPAVVCAALVMGACAAYTPTPLEGAERQQAYDAYMTDVNSKVAVNWSPLTGARDYPNQIIAAGKSTSVVWAVIDQFGQVVTMEVYKPGNPAFDREAVRAVAMASPLPPPPEGLLYRSSRGLVAGIPVKFTVTVPGAEGSLTQGRFLAQGKGNVGVSPAEISLEL